MPLELPPEDFDLLADRVGRAASEYLAGLDGRASFPVKSGAATAEVFHRPLPGQRAGSAAFDDLAVIADYSRPGSGLCFADLLRSGASGRMGHGEGPLSDGGRAGTWRGEIGGLR